jgi:hypothetical protein
MPEPTADYTPTWRRYRIWYAVSLILFVAYLPAFVIASHFFPGAMHRASVIIPAFFAYGITWMVVTVVAKRWKCPRCGRPFFLTPVMQTQPPMLFIRSCRSCGLPKYAGSDPALASRSSE